MAQESLLSGPNLFWFAAGIAAEVFFLGYGITPQGMNMAAQVASSLGLMDSFNVASGAASLAMPGMGMESIAPVPSLDTLDFGIG